MERLARMRGETITIGKRSLQLYSIMNWKENTCVSYTTYSPLEEGKLDFK